jgi:hypothetical protein
LFSDISGSLRGINHLAAHDHIESFLVEDSQQYQTTVDAITDIPTWTRGFIAGFAQTPSEYIIYCGV